MNLRHDVGWNPPRSAYFGDYGQVFNAMDPRSWDYEATPDYIKKGDEYFQDEEYAVNREVLGIDIVKNVLSSFPVIGSLLGGFMSIPSQLLHKKQSELLNARNIWEARRADWYNSPRSQISRLRIAGLNPFMQSYVKSYPANIPSFSLPTNVSVPSHSESIAGLMNAFTNAELAEHRIDNLDSLTAINEYKEQNLLPQLFAKNGYVNSILHLQVAWETKNYEYERQLKQNILDANYELALLDTAQGLMETSAQIPGSYVKVDVKKGTLVVQIPDENGDMKNYDLNDIAFDKLPPVLQKSLVDIWQTKQITNSRVQLNTITGNTQSALGGLYNSQKHKVDIYCNTYDETGVWPDEDITLRYAAGLLGSKTYWSNWGLNSLDKVFETGLDVGSLYLNPKTALQRTGTTVPQEIPKSPVLTPQPLNIPRGAKPYTFKGQTYWYYPK